MTKHVKVIVEIFLSACLAIAFCISDTLFAEQVPPLPGTKIDKNNLDQYNIFFPEEFLDAFTTGWELITPLSITVTETKPNPHPKKFMELSEKNRGKYSIDADGYVTGGTFQEIIGFPFPDVTPGEQNFVLKLMWNYDYRYAGDDAYMKFNNYQKRRGEAMTTSLVESWQMAWQGRVENDPKPIYPSNTGFRNANLLRVLDPPSMRNLLNLLIRYSDQKKPDITYVYLPTMRRVLRGEAGQRSTPINSSTQAPDDFNGGFAGRIADFNYRLVGETKIIGQSHAEIGYKEIKDKEFDYIPMEMDNWEVRDVYVIDIFPKDPKYPQARKRIWLDKENYWSLYAAAYDRAGALWKIWQTAGCVVISSGGFPGPGMKGMLGLDIQLGYGVQMVSDIKVNGNGITESDVSVNAMRRIAK